MTSLRPWRQAERHLASCDPVLRRLIKKHGPCQLALRGDYFTVLCRSILSQQLATRAAAAITARFNAYYDEKPAPDKVLATPAGTLRELGLSGQKTSYIQDLAAKILDGHITFGNFAALPDDEVVEQLVGVKGVGVWTAQMFLIFALNRADVLPADDFGVRKAVMLNYKLETMPNKAIMETIAAPWQPWRSVASWYMWRSLDSE